MVAHARVFSELDSGLHAFSQEGRIGAYVIAERYFFGADVQILSDERFGLIGTNRNVRLIQYGNDSPLAHDAGIPPCFGSRGCGSWENSQQDSDREQGAMEAMLCKRLRRDHLG